MGTAIVVTSGKGGTGKTSFTGGVSSCLASHGHKVLCLDADIGLRNLDITLGLADRALMDFTDVIAGRCLLSQAIVPHPSIGGLHLLTAPTRLPPGSIPEGGMRALVQEIKKQFEYCIIDGPAGIGSAFHLASCGADRAVVVCTTDASSLRDAQRTVTELQQTSSIPIHLVVNRVRPKTMRRLHSTIDDVMDAAGLPLLGVVPEDEDVFLSANQGIPLAQFAKRGAIRAYDNIAHRLEGSPAPILKFR